MACAGLAACRARSGEVSGLLSAAKITPGDADLWQRAGLKLVESDPRRAMSYMEKAVRLNPRNANALLGIGFLNEKSGKSNDAEQYYLSATRVSKRYKPYSSLAAFYFREDRQSLFWAWAVQAAAIDSANLETLFRMAHLVSQSSREIPSQLKLESQGALNSYLMFLLREGSLENVANVAEKLDFTAPHIELLLNACDRLLDAGRPADAVRIWNRLGVHGGAAFTRLQPLHGIMLVNGTFRPAPMRGFNWRSNKTPEVTVKMREPSGFRVEFSGKQAEAGTILNQPLALIPGLKYRLRFRADVSDLPSVDGLQWAIVAGKELRTRGAWSSHVPEGIFEFQAPAEPATLVLRYDRIPGTVRLRGSFTLLFAELKRLP